MIDVGKLVTNSMTFLWLNSLNKVDQIAHIVNVVVRDKSKLERSPQNCSLINHVFSHSKQNVYEEKVMAITKRINTALKY